MLLIMPSFPFYRWEDWGNERFSNSTEDTDLGSPPGRAQALDHHTVPPNQWKGPFGETHHLLQQGRLTPGALSHLATPPWFACETSPTWNRRMLTWDEPREFVSLNNSVVFQMKPKRRPATCALQPDPAMRLKTARHCGPRISSDALRALAAWRLSWAPQFPPLTQCTASQHPTNAVLVPRGSS